MKKRLVLLLILPFILIGCRQQPVANIAATTRPVWEFTTAICSGTDITVSRLVTENVSCLHDYSVQVSHMRAVEAADAVVINGAGLEDFLRDTLESASYVIDASRQITELHHSEHNHGHDEHHHDADPHIWLSPVNAMEMSRAICCDLIALYPENAAIFEKNLAELLEKLDALQTYGENTLRDLKIRKLITFHDGFSYFAESFDLTILKSVKEESGSEASAQELLTLIELVGAENVPSIFTEVNGSTSAAEIIAQETGVAVYTLDMAMSEISYFDAMYANIDAVKEALG